MRSDFYQGCEAAFMLRGVTSTLNIFEGTQSRLANVFSRAAILDDVRERMARPKLALTVNTPLDIIGFGGYGLILLQEDSNDGK